MSQALCLQSFGIFTLICLDVYSNKKKSTKSLVRQVDFASSQYLFPHVTFGYAVFAKTNTIIRPSIILTWVGHVLCFLFFREHKQVLGSKTCFFKAQTILDHSIFSWVFQYPVIPRLDVEMLIWVNGFCPFFPGGLTSCFHIILSTVRLFTYKCQNFSGDPVL
jgi:hypothetical protein